MKKLAFDVEAVLDRVEQAVQGFPKAALFELAEDGYDSPFEILIACIISIRTRDETTLPTAQALFAVARTPQALARLTPEQIDQIIRACTFHEPKAAQIHQIASRIVSELAGNLPCNFDVLTSFRGVGPKCANLTLGIACPQQSVELGIGVDIHVHRVTNRWGYIQANSPEQSMRQLQEKLPRRHWVRINAILVPFGKHICTGTLPQCSTCPVLAWCGQVGVLRHR